MHTETDPSWPRLGQTVEYLSRRENKWIRTRVVALNIAKGTFDLTCKKSVEPSRIRAVAESSIGHNAVSMAESSIGHTSEKDGSVETKKRKEAPQHCPSDDAVISKADYAGLLKASLDAARVDLPDFTELGLRNVLGVRWEGGSHHGDGKGSCGRCGSALPHSSPGCAPLLGRTLAYKPTW